MLKGFASADPFIYINDDNMEIFNNIFWITGIWFFVWSVMYLLGEMFIDIFYLKPEKVKNIKKYTILLTIVILIFYILQIIDYVNIIK